MLMLALKALPKSKNSTDKQTNTALISGCHKAFLGGCKGFQRGFYGLAM